MRSISGHPARNMGTQPKQGEVKMDKILGLAAASVLMLSSAFAQTPVPLSSDTGVVVAPFIGDECTHFFLTHPGTTDVPKKYGIPVPAAQATPAEAAAYNSDVTAILTAWGSGKPLKLSTSNASLGCVDHSILAAFGLGGAL
jgi:hypothetical protein